LPIYIDLSACFDDRDVKTEFRNRLEKNLKAFTLDEAYQSPDDAHDSIGFVEHVCEWLNSQGVGLLLLLDEIEQLENEEFEGRRRVEQRLRALLGKPDLQLRAIIGAARVLRRTQEQRSETSRFINLFTIEYIGAISLNEAEQLIRQRQGAAPVRVAEAVVDKILERAACEPYLCQYLCQKLYQPDNTLGTPAEEDLTEFDPIFDGILECDYEYLEEKEQAVLVRIARGQQGDLPPGVAELRELGYIKQIGDEYQIGNHFLKTWVQQNRLDESDRPQTEPKKQDAPTPVQDRGNTDAPSRSSSGIFVPILSAIALMIGFSGVAYLLQDNPAVLALVAAFTVIVFVLVLAFAGLDRGLLSERTFFKLASRALKQGSSLSSPPGEKADADEDSSEG